MRVLSVLYDVSGALYNVWELCIMCGAVVRCVCLVLCMMCGSSV